MFGTVTVKVKNFCHISFCIVQTEIKACSPFIVFIVIRHRYHIYLKTIQKYLSVISVRESRKQINPTTHMSPTLNDNVEQ
jgi:hypothetical protein